jgi:uncharacterized protein
LLACYVRPVARSGPRGKTRGMKERTRGSGSQAAAGAGALGWRLLCAAFLATSSCAIRGVPAPATATSPPPKAIRSGTLVTYKSGRELWREEYRDDGETLVSRLSVAGRTAIVHTSRSSRTVEVEEGPHRVRRDIPAGTIALENGDWQAYAIAAEWYADAHEPRPVQVLVPGQGAVVDGTIAISNGAGGRREVKLTIGTLVATAMVDADGRVVEARVPAQGLDVRQPAAGPPSNIDSPPQATSSAVGTPTDIEVHQDGGILAGEIWLPKAATPPVPLAVIVPGSGPTDRDGNSELGLQTDAYKQIATALAQRGIATLRYDKRGVGRSQGHREDTVTLTSMCRDLTAVVREAKSKVAFSSVTVVGHSEGGLVALKSIGDLQAAALVLVATPGRPLGAVLREQLAKAGVPIAEVDKALLEASKGDTVPSPRPEIRAIFRPSVFPFLRSIVDVDPATLLRKTTISTTIVQGDTDRQISVHDAQQLHAARPDARLVVVHQMNHALKQEASEELPQRSYTDPMVPLAPAVVDAIAEAARR